ncbi:MAG TPA: hypothetical protein VM711_07745, partial [Sphingomicrobium sp.]|nr:hypothetical protein [Sphingomicrobium sp.]
MAAIAWHFWPGVAMYDTLEQYSQVLTGKVDDWHPPAMVRLWQLLRPLGPGASPMFVLQVGLYAAGFSLIIAALARCSRPFSGLAVLVLAISPLLLGWQMVVLKDAQMLGALIGAFAIILGCRLSGRRIPPPLALTAGLLLAYATLVRANAAFATVPLIVLIFPRPRSLILRGGLALAIIGVVLALTPLADRSLFGASNSGVAKSLPLFDLAAIAVAVPDAPGPFTRAERDQISKLHCVKDYFWDPLGDPTACGPITERVRAEPETQLYAELAHALIAHPLAYAAHRIRHWNSTERWLVASGLPDMAPPDET